MIRPGAGRCWVSCQRYAFPVFRGPLCTVSACKTIEDSAYGERRSLWRSAFGVPYHAIRLEATQTSRTRLSEQPSQSTITSSRVVGRRRKRTSHASSAMRSNRARSLKAPCSSHSLTRSSRGAIGTISETKPRMRERCSTVCGKWYSTAKTPNLTPTCRSPSVTDPRITDHGKRTPRP